ncbi:translocon-associated protein subunit alpha-like, partial [Rutidosis leptorrhynchoides]|uniref:translocon-associated protein subunit alpha-like n=1 Tax=Rutidosis leptorrhynchoides TaxID=125765 RepID=UPI003A99B112
EALGYGDGSFDSAPGIVTVAVFPKNSARLIQAGEESELLAGLKNDAESSVNVIAITASVRLSYDHRYTIQNITAQTFTNATVPASAQATFPFIFTLSKFFQAGTFDLVGTVYYEIDQQPYQSTFYNGTIEVVEAGGSLSIESVFLVALGIGLLALLFTWIKNEIKNFSKKTKRPSKVETGTSTTDSSQDEWLQGTAFAQSQSGKQSKKKK